MSTYLVVARYTATSPELLEGLLRRKIADPSADFVLLVPDIDLEHNSSAERNLFIEDVRAHLARSTISPSRVEVSQEAPLAAIEKS